jgi:hypothetical protein
MRNTEFITASMPSSTLARFVPQRIGPGMPGPWSFYIFSPELECPSASVVGQAVPGMPGPYTALM